MSAWFQFENWSASARQLYEEIRYVRTYIIYGAHFDCVVVHLFLILFFLLYIHTLIPSQLFALAAFDASSFRLWIVISSIILLFYIAICLYFFVCFGRILLFMVWINFLLFMGSIVDRPKMIYLKNVAAWLKTFLSKYISYEQFDFSSEWNK